MNVVTGDLHRKIYYWIYILAADKQTVISQIQLLVQYTGLQLGYFLHRAGRDYVIFEKNSTVGEYHESIPPGPHGAGYQAPQPLIPPLHGWLGVCATGGSTCILSLVPRP